LGRAIELLNKSPNSVLLSMAHNALGLCRYGACDFATAESAFLEALNLAQKMGDDARASLTATNIAGLYLIQGKFPEAAEMGCWSARLGAGLTGQPRMINAYMNAAEAFMMCGRKEDAARYMELAKNHRSGHRTWKAELEFLCENASLALIGGDTSHALEIIASAEAAAVGREAAVPEPAVFAKLRTFRVMHSGGPDAARPLVEQALDRFRSRHLLYFLEVLATKAWLEKLMNDSHLSQTSTELGMFDRSGAHGLKAKLAAEGFLAS
jgi:tetratricopeptide (TPR) repeat protein